MDDATLARLENENMAEWLRVSCGQVPGSIVRAEGGITAFGTGLPPGLFNQIVVTGDDATDAGMIAAIRALRERGAPFYLVLRRGVDDGFGPLAIELGLTLEDGILPGMALHQIALDPGLPDGHEIRRITDTAGLDDPIRTLADGFELPEPMVRAWVGEELWRRDDCAVYTGYTDGRCRAGSASGPAGRSASTRSRACRTPGGTAMARR